MLIISRRGADIAGSRALGASDLSEPDREISSAIPFAVSEAIVSPILEQS